MGNKVNIFTRIFNWFYYPQFIKHAKLKWKVEKISGDCFFGPYCPKCRLKLFAESYRPKHIIFYCQKDHFKSDPITINEFKRIKKEVHNIIEKKFDM